MKTFEELNLIAAVQRALTDESYETPTPIQAQTIPAAMGGKDVLGCAQTGTGKTAAFALPILNQLGQRNRKAPANRPLALILAPTRELAIQIGDSFNTYGRHLRLRTTLVYGGVNQWKQVKSLNRGAHILVATPGRLLDLMNQGHIKLDQLQVFVLDEADRMLDMGFLPDLKRIISQLPEQRQSLFFSATLSPKIIELTETLLRDPVSVNVTPEQPSVERIEQRIMHVERSGKQPWLRKILTSEGAERSLVFVKTKRAADMLVEQLDRYEIRSTAIHGNKSQSARQKALEAFRRNRVNVLIATDVAARGIDIDGITHVINFDLPMEPENYVHRIGRTGRAGAEGIALSFCSSIDRNLLRSIEQQIGQKVPVDPEYPAPQRSGPSGSNGRRKPGRNRSSSKSGSPHSASRRPTEGGSQDGKPKRKRRPKRKGQVRRQPSGDSK